jgi:hypothetical protein
VKALRRFVNELAEAGDRADFPLAVVFPCVAVLAAVFMISYIVGWLTAGFVADAPRGV